MLANDVKIEKVAPRPSKGYKGMNMEGFIATWYAKITHKDMDEFKALARRLAASLPAGSRVLEVAPGPGYLSVELAGLGGTIVTGLDISHTFVEIARRNAAAAGVAVEFRQGDASAMPFEDGTFDLVVCRAAFKNFSRPVEALAEMRRVLKSGGRALVIDLRRDVPPDSMDRYVDGLGLGKINALITKWTFRTMLIKRAYTRREAEELAARAGFEKCHIDESLTGFEIWLEK
jgi:ubiquinone/menaquinone biosynthesis C-methylase UbiE